MAESNQPEGKIKRRLRLTVFVDESFAPLWTMRFTPLGAVIGAAFVCLLLIAGVTVLIAFTGLREYIPGYPTGEERTQLMSNLQRVDSLAREIAMRDNMLHNLRQVMSGDVPTAQQTQQTQASATKTGDTTTARITRETLMTLHELHEPTVREFMDNIEKIDRYEVSSGEPPVDITTGLESTFFYTPLKGLVSDGFGVRGGHYGVDVPTQEGMPVMSTLDGTVFFSEWTVQTGHVIMIQHEGGLVSVYKHNSRLLRHPGERVQAGQAIALSGDSGELTSGPHLHFELWRSGTPLNPENFISFGDDLGGAQ